MPNDSILKYINFLKPRVAPGVFRDYKTALSRMGEIISLEELDAWVSRRVSEEGVSAKTVNNNLCAFKGWVRWALSRGVVLSPKILEYRPLKHRPLKHRRPLTAEEIRELMAVSGGRRDWWAFLVLTGLRRSEFESLAWDNVDLEKGAVVVGDAKDKAKERAVPLHTKAAQILRSRWRPGIQGRVFRELPVNLLRPFKRDLQKAGINPGVDIHCLRVTFITALARAGVGPRTAQELAGHRDLRTTLEIYTKVEDSDRVGAIARLRPW